MINKLLAATLAITLLSAPLAYSQEVKAGDKLTDAKKEMINSMNAEKSIIDQAINCINSAQTRTDLKKCRDIRKTGVEQVKSKIQQLKENQKQELTNRIQGQLLKLGQEGAAQ